jgi:hypothetical protein
MLLPSSSRTRSGNHFTQSSRSINNSYCFFCCAVLQAPLLVKSAVEALVDMGGVRIEDNVLVTADGHFNLTMAAAMPKEAAEIEAYMAAHNSANN